MLFDGWGDVGRVVATGVLAYVYLVFLLRVTGKRTLSKMNAFDFVVTIATGSAFAAALVDQSVSVSEAMAAFTVLALVQLAVAWSQVRSERFEKVVKSVPTILVWRGGMRREVMRRARVSEAEVLAACRGAGLLSLGEVEAVVLETTGDFSVLKKPSEPVAPEESTLRTAASIPGDDS